VDAYVPRLSSAARQAAEHGGRERGESQGIDAERRAIPTKWLPRTQCLFDAVMYKLCASDTKTEKTPLSFE
jgi:hypothetical protein